MAQALQDLATIPQTINPFLFQRTAGSSCPLSCSVAKLVTTAVVLHLRFDPDSLGETQQWWQVGWSPAVDPMPVPPATLTPRPS
jgi:hypothetical protein